MALWSLLASPLIMGNDARKIRAASRAILLNKPAIAISQDPLGTPGVRLWPPALSRAKARHNNQDEQPREHELWARNLTGGDVAVGLYNKGTAANTSASTCRCCSGMGLGQRNESPGIGGVGLVATHTQRPPTPRPAPSPSTSPRSALARPRPSRCLTAGQAPPLESIEASTRRLQSRTTTRCSCASAALLKSGNGAVLVDKLLDRVTLTCVWIDCH